MEVLAMLKRIGASSRTLGAVAGLVLVVALLVGYFVPTAEALPPNEVWREYYSEAAHINLVGEKVLFCNGQTWKWGITTAHVVVYTTPCW
jgi:hypothetical protein